MSLSPRFFELTLMMTELLQSIDRKHPPGEIPEDQIMSCPLCQQRAKREDANQALPPQIEAALDYLIPLIPERTQWIARAMLAHILSCAAWTDILRRVLHEN